MAFNPKEEAKELHRFLREAEKAASEGDCVNILSRIKSLSVSAESIVSSKAGNLLKPLKKHKNPEIRSLVSDIKKTWSARVNAAFSSSNRPETKNRFKKPVTASSTQLEGANLERSKNLTSVLVKTNDPKRDLIRKQLHDSFSMVLTEMGATTQLQGGEESLDPARVAVEVEDVLFKKWGTDKSNNAKYRSLLFNVKNEKNKDFRRRLLVGEIKAEEVPGMKTEDMMSDEMRLKAKVMTDRALLRKIVGIDKKGTTNEFRCERCGERNASYFQLQTRSADEPMTTFFTCAACDYRWKD